MCRVPAINVDFFQWSYLVEKIGGGVSRQEKKRTKNCSREFYAGYLDKLNLYRIE